MGHHMVTQAETRAVAIREAMASLDAATLEKVLITGDLEPLTPEQRMMYYAAVCRSTGLNPLTKPFDYIKLNGMLRLYAKKDATEQLREIHNATLVDLDRSYSKESGVISVMARYKLPSGREDADIGVVVVPPNATGDVLANALMKAVTKAKRRATLSICGLGWLDEAELDTITLHREAVEYATGITEDAPAPAMPERRHNGPDVVAEPSGLGPLTEVLENGDIHLITSEGELVLTLPSKTGEPPIDVTRLQDALSAAAIDCDLLSRVWNHIKSIGYGDDDDLRKSYGRKWTEAQCS
jgi:hypothetical protein